ncbi:tetratricopeptide repeat protein, partial [uncultured Tenacibaculum sp.]|uniref:tetratricopeptide repeat protein n=1 Tax=uncultured Tenacibaculum sp. TaxID=174713 RepID=UPI00260AC046
ARKWFKKAAKLGNDKAAYSLGYLYLKGFGNIEQDYNKAVKWFLKSEHPMAKYWLGVCYYNGYGVEKNIAKANTLLETNFTETETTISSSVSTDKDTENTPANELIVQEQQDEVFAPEITEETLLGKWKGKLLLLDWSKNHIKTKKDIEIIV